MQETPHLLKRDILISPSSIIQLAKELTVYVYMEHQYSLQHYVPAGGVAVTMVSSQTHVI